MTKYSAFLSKTAIKQLELLDKKLQERVKSAIRELEEDPFRPRPKADIKKLYKLTKHQLYRLRIGNYRIAYAVENSYVKVAKIFPRGKGYEWLE